MVYQGIYRVVYTGRYIPGWYIPGTPSLLPVSLLVDNPIPSPLGFTFLIKVDKSSGFRVPLRLTTNSETEEREGSRVPSLHQPENKVEI